jgi:hypothetical protein
MPTAAAGHEVSASVRQCVFSRTNWKAGFTVRHGMNLFIGALEKKYEIDE